MRKFVTILLVMLLLATGLMAAILYSSPFSGWRQTVAASYLNELLEQKVKINGSVDIELGSQVAIEITDVALAGTFRPTAKKQHVNKIRFSFPIGLAFAGTIAVNSFTLDGAHVEILVDDNKTTTGDVDPLTYVGGALSAFLNNPISRHFILRDVTIDIVEPNNGWNENIKITQLSFQNNTNDMLIEIIGKGTFNDYPLAINGKVGGQENVSQRELNLSIVYPGSEAQIIGRIDTSSEIAAIDLEVSTKSKSLGDLLESLGLARTLDGEGQFSGQLIGPMNNLKLENIDADAAGSGGTRLEASGRVDNFNTGAGIDLHFTGKLPEIPEKTGPRTKLIDIELTGFSGELGGTKDEINLDQLVLTTNIASAELSDIGPITIDRITKDEEGRLGILGIHILDGPPEARTLDLTGDITDALRLAGINLSGKLDIATAELFELKNAKDAEKLGRVLGNISITDTGGSLGIDRFEASVSNSDLVALKINHKIGDISHFEDFSLSVDLKIPNYSAFAAAVGQKSALKGPFNFSGQVSYGNETPSIDGMVTVRKTVFSGKLEGVVRNEQPVIVGGIGSKLLYLEDLQWLGDILGLKANSSIRNVDINDDFSKNMAADLKVDIGKIAGTGKAVGKIKGQLKYEKEIVTLNPLQVTYLGGLIQANTKINIKGKSPRLTSAGKITKLPIGRILGALGAPPLISGSLSANFNIAASGRNLSSVAKSLTGKVTASIWGGVLGTNLLDLSGLNLVTWIATKNDKNKVKIVCAVMPFNFKNGRGTTGGLVFETDGVQVAGTGSIDFRKDAVSLKFNSIPKRKQMVDIATPFNIVGKLSKPSIVTKQSSAGRAVAEVVTLPLNLLGLLATGGKEKSTKYKPCVVRKSSDNAKPKKKSRPANAKKKSRPKPRTRKTRNPHRK